jgi:putative oxidoreductase
MQTIRRFVDESVASLSGARVKDFVTSLLRLVIGLLFVGHACQKAFGWFGGDGIQAWMATVQKATFQPAVLWAYLESAAELGGGLLLVLGLLTPVATALLIADMFGAILKVHAPGGLWSQNGGFEYNLVLIALMIALGDWRRALRAGPPPPSGVAQAAHVSGGSRRYPGIGGCSARTCIWPQCAGAGWLRSVEIIGRAADPGADLLVLLAIAVRNVYKPTRVTPYGRRKQREPQSARRAVVSNVSARSSRPILGQVVRTIRVSSCRAETL